MGEIILFEPRPRGASSRAAVAPECAAQILFFTGVRYTAYVEPTARTDGRSGGKPRPDNRRRARKQA